MLYETMKFNIFYIQSLAEVPRSLYRMKLGLSLLLLLPSLAVSAPGFASEENMMETLDSAFSKAAIENNTGLEARLKEPGERFEELLERMESKTQELLNKTESSFQKLFEGIESRFEEALESLTGVSTKVIQIVNLLSYMTLFRKHQPKGRREGKTKTQK